MAVPPLGTTDPTAALRAAVGRLVNRTAHWTPARWALPAKGGPRRRTRADEIFALIQRLADLGATAEGRPGRKVPRPDSDLTLDDQLRVMANDLVAAAPTDDLIRTATEAVNAANTALDLT